MTEHITIVDPLDGSEYNLVVTTRNAEKAQNDGHFAEELLNQAKQQMSAEIHVSDYNPVMKWTDEAVDIMIQIYKEGAPRKKNWAKMAKMISALGTYVTISQCRGKMKSLKTMYLNMSKTDGITAQKRKWKPYEALHEIYGHLVPPRSTPSKTDENNTNQEGDRSAVGTTDEATLDDTTYEVEEPPPKIQRELKRCRLNCNMCNAEKALKEEQRLEKRKFLQDLIEILKTFPSSGKKFKPAWQDLPKAMTMVVQPILDMPPSDDSDCC